MSSLRVTSLRVTSLPVTGRSDRPSARRLRRLALAAAAIAGLAAAPALAEDAAPKDAAPKTDEIALRVCASAKGAPYTMGDGSGFENRVAEAVAAAMGRKATFVYTDKPAIYLVRDFLDKQLCDVVMGVDDGDDRVLTTNPYYRTGYVFVTRRDHELEISNWSDEDLRRVKTIAYQFHSPAEVMLKQTGLYEDNLIYQYSLVNFSDRRNQYKQVPGELLVSEVIKGSADVAVAFAPDVARYVKSSSTPLVMTVIDQNGLTESGQVVPQQYDQSMAVRKDDTALRDALNAALVKARPEIETILRDEGIPLLPLQS